MTDKSEPIDPVDRLISAVQGKPISDPVPLPAGTNLAVPVIDNVHNLAFDNLGRPDLTEPNRVILWYREIERSLSSSMKASEQIEKFSNWKQFKLSITSSAKLSLMPERERINFIIGLATEQGICLYPKTLFAFEWYDQRLQKTLRQDMPQGFCRGR